ncbi:hypothetical protein CIPAW_03G234100 [Carya illinoinensis]|uniref:Uncharacterized protein n=1 Tax=Carya illinoinensis TaxID=32201 RepID=A0A8T1R597_CARIL|nr:hypothetical protein CIPAW_03G234100 [Carya illinoinensis]KAG6723726.1 hypothetical protein I3842_03G222300 [Carya illinoinensis]
MVMPCHFTSIKKPAFSSCHTLSFRQGRLWQRKGKGTSKRKKEK